MIGNPRQTLETHTCVGAYHHRRLLRKPEPGRG